MAAHEPGKMNIVEQEKTFEGFIKSGVILSVVVIFLLILLAIFGI
ncbi:MAG: aa3-type cytochrome c oxidase subunit IV [Pseudomonadota bacterium]